MMSNPRKTINDEIQYMIDNTIRNKIYYPVNARITHLYPESECVDVETDEYGVLLYVPCLGSPVLNSECFVFFRGNSLTDALVVMNPSDIISRLDALESRVSVLEGLLEG